MRDKKVEWGGTAKKEERCLAYLNKRKASLWSYQHGCLMWLPALLPVHWPLSQYYWSKLLHGELLPFLFGNKMEDLDTRKKRGYYHHISKLCKWSNSHHLLRMMWDFSKLLYLTAGRRKGRQTALIAGDNVPDIYCRYSGISVAYFWNTVEYFKNRSVVWVGHCSLASKREMLWRAE